MSNTYSNNNAKILKRRDIHPTIQQALGTHEAFRKLGFSAEEIFVHLNPDKSMLVVLKSQEKQFSVTVGVIDMAYDKWIGTWNAVIEAVNNHQIAPATLDIIWQASLPFKEPIAFMENLVSKGIRPPCFGMGDSN